VGTRATEIFLSKHKISFRKIKNSLTLPLLVSPRAIYKNLKTCTAKLPKNNK